MKRGDLVTVVASGDFGKPRPALVVQSDRFAEVESVTVLLVSSDLYDAPHLRLTIDPDAINGLRKTSQVIIDKVMSIKKPKVGPAFGRLNEEQMASITRSLALFLGVA